MSGNWIATGGIGTFQVGVDCPSTVTRLWVRGIGGGGGGGGFFDTGGFVHCGGGGGAGGYFEDVITVTNTSVLNWEVGEGGAGAVFGAYNNGEDGFDTVLEGAIAEGGNGGLCTSLNIAGGFGGGASGATVTIEGGPGGVGFVGTSTDAFEIFTGNGGIGCFGGGSIAAEIGSSSSIGAPGAGGGGHVGANVSTSTVGNTGILIITWFQ